MRTNRWHRFSEKARRLWRRSGKRGRPRVRLIGDHSPLHAGCSAVVDYLKGEIARFGTLTQDDRDYDLLLVNGEGTMHHDSRGHHQKMKALALAVSEGKPAYLLNSVWQENSPEYDEVLRQLSGITVREIMSHDDLLERHGVASQVHLDVSLWAPVDENVFFTHHSNAVVMSDFYSQEFGNFVRLTGGPASRRYPFVAMGEMSWSRLVCELRTASVFLTGRHHGVFAACRARTPFVTLPGNTHKIEGMIRMSGLPIPVCRSPREVFDTLGWVEKNREVYQEFFRWIAAQPPLRLEEVIRPEHRYAPSAA